VGKLRVDQPSLDDAFVALTTSNQAPETSSKTASR
jgi:hypothetical protein